VAHFANIFNGKVVQVIVAEQEFIDTLPGEWVQTSYNTYGGEHRLGGTPLRKNFAGIGYVYDNEKDAFYAEQPFPSWTLNEQTCLWEPPVAKPNTSIPHFWNETDQKWALNGA
jgi:hypothetical protein